MTYSVAQAAKAIGKSKHTVLRGISSGKISAARDEATGAYRIEPSELHRVFAPVARAAHEPVQDVTNATIRLAVVEALLSEKDAALADLRRRLDQSDEERRRLTLLLADQRPVLAPAAAVAAPNRVRGWRFWRRKSNAG